MRAADASGGEGNGGTHDVAYARGEEESAESPSSTADDETESSTGGMGDPEAAWIAWAAWARAARAEWATKAMPRLGEVLVECRKTPLPARQWVRLPSGQVVCPRMDYEADQKSVAE